MFFQYSLSRKASIQFRFEKKNSDSQLFCFIAQIAKRIPSLQKPFRRLLIDKPDDLCLFEFFKKNKGKPLSTVATGEDKHGR